MTELAALLGKKFIERRDAKSWHCPPNAIHKTWHYEKDASKVTMSNLRQHLSGERSMGHYLVDPATQMCRVFVLDIDLNKTATWEGVPVNPREVFLGPDGPDRDRLIAMLNHTAHGFARRTSRLAEIPVACALSGNKGVHVYGFLDPMPAADARAAAHEVLDSFDYVPARQGENFWASPVNDDITIEVYPKQDTVEPGSFGNLVRLPLGVNGASGKPGAFIHFRGPDACKFYREDPEQALTGKLPWA